MAEEILCQGFLRSTGRMPDRPALFVEERVVPYAELHERASRIAATIQMRAPASDPPLVAVFGDRSLTMFAGILGALMAGRAYVPLNPTFPIAKTRQMFQHSGCRALVADAGAEVQLDGLLKDLGNILVLLPDRTDVKPLADRWPQHEFVGGGGLEPESSWTSPPVSYDALAYLLFTSGSTGTPKGVMVTHANATHFVRTAVERYGITPSDRLSQMFDTTFDLSVFDMFVAWHQGACVCCPPRETLWNPDRFIREQQLTVWFSVPTVAMLMNRFGVLKPGRYPSLRWSLFCGERLPAESATAWAAAAPGSVLENLYGPTELTVACMAYRWDADRSPAESTLGVVPIGHPLPGMRALVVDESLLEVAPGEAGELLMTGPQRTPGYWRNDEATDRAYVRLDGHDGLFYRTGDRVRRPVGTGPMTFLGRVDQQIKVRGHRVELGEVESTLREYPGVESATALAWPTTSAGAQGIAAFVTGRNIEPAAIRSSLQSRLEEYAVPQTIRVLPDLPLNANGKVDRRALMTMLEA